MNAPGVTVILCVHNPHAGRLERVLQALRAQALPAGEWTMVVVDNASSPPVATRGFEWPANATIIEERELGLTAARLTGIAAATGDVLVFIDDDTVAAPDYLAVARELMRSSPEIGAAGGRIRGDFEQPPASWMRNFLDMLAIRDFGERPIRALARNVPGPWEPCGAGMVVRRDVAGAYAQVVRSDARRRLDRVGARLSSCGDTDLARTATDLGLYVAYEPRLHLTHLIPATRLRFGYLARLTFAINRDAWLLLRLRGQRCEVGGLGLWLRRIAVPLRSVRPDPREWGLRIAAAWGQLQGRSLPLEEPR